MSCKIKECKGKGIPRLNGSEHFPRRMCKNHYTSFMRKDKRRREREAEAKRYAQATSNERLMQKYSNRWVVNA